MKLVAIPFFRQPTRQKPEKFSPISKLGIEHHTRALLG
jgi:hypothetical protein